MILYINGGEGIMPLWVWWFIGLWIVLFVFGLLYA